MQKIDIRKIKNSIRSEAKEYRLSLGVQSKRDLDNKIFKALVDNKELQGASTVLCYASTSIEVDTTELINALLQNGKNVALPRCVDGTRNMEFYLINSLDQTEKHTFGVMEPNPKICEKLRDFRNCVCIIPGLCFDLEGYRLGYGKGYYDRFLSSFRGYKIGVCYDECIKNKLPKGFFDVAADIVITEKRQIACKKDRTEKTNGRKKGFGVHSRNS